MKYWIKPNIENRIKSGEIRGYFNSNVIEILPDSLRVATPEGEVTLRNDFVFALVGYRPDLEFLAATGITLEAILYVLVLVLRRWRVSAQAFTSPA